MIRQCDRAVTCFPCADEASNPFNNLSAELADTNIFLSVQFRQLVNPPPNRFGSDSCVGFCESAISQYDADDCARRAAFECITGEKDWCLSEDGSICTNPPATFCNPAMEFQSGDQCYSIPACTVLALSQVDANAIAQSLGNFRVHDSAATEACAQPPEPPLPPPASDCPLESGSPAPDSLEIDSLQSWETFEVLPSLMEPVVSANVGNNPTGLWTFVWPNIHDHPPGSYEIEYVSGFLLFNPTQCDPGEVSSMAQIYQLWDDEHNYDTPVVGNPPSMLANRFKRVEPEPYTGFFGAGTDDCTVNNDIAQTNYNAHYNTVGAKKRFVFDLGDLDGGLHTNTGGDFKYVLSDNILGDPGIPVINLIVPPPGFEFFLKVVQASGLIPQPRRVKITDYASLIAQFADPAAAAGWNGQFNTRTTYTDMALLWQVAAAGAFGGSKLSWTTSHPTSANGKGWMLELYSPGMVLFWKGYKAVASTSLGRFYKDMTSTAFGPDCLVCEDNSTMPWEPVV